MPQATAPGARRPAVLRALGDGAPRAGALAGVMPRGEGARLGAAGGRAAAERCAVEEEIGRAAEEARSAFPVSVGVARTLNAAGQSRVTLSPR